MRYSWCWLVCVVTIRVDADLLWDFPADSDGNLLVLIMALLPGNILAGLVWLVNTFLLGNILTRLAGNINTLLLRDLIAHRVGHLPFLCLGYILALIIGVLLACSWYWCPYLAIPLTFPPILAVCTVLCSTL